MKYKYFILFVSIFLITFSIIYLERQKPPRLPNNTNNEIIVNQESMDNQNKSQKFFKAREIVSPAGFINTDGITVQELAGKKVILLDFWTYSCINCQRTLPYLTSWYSKYKDQGLEIIGIHTPEFAFEKKLENVQWAVDKYNIKYPVVLDNDYGTWNAYGNRYWPRKYLIDIDGYVVYDHIGEGEYDKTEQKIQELLKERNVRLDTKIDIAKNLVSPDNTEKPTAASPETYFGALRNSNLGNGIQNNLGMQILNEPRGIKQNILYLDGKWNFTNEFATNKNAMAKIIYRYNAQKVFLVMSAEKSIIAEILLDGKPLDENSAGVDIIFKNNKSFVEINKERLYRLIEKSPSFGSHTFELIIKEPGANVYAFTFG